MFKKVLAGVTAFTMLSLAGCGADSSTSDDTSISSETTTETEETEPATTAEKVKTASETLSTDGDEKEADTTSDENSSETSEESTANLPDVPEPEPYFTDTELAIKDAVDKALTAYMTADSENILKYSDLDIAYYMAYGEKAPESEILDALEENGTTILPMEETVDWEVVNIAPVGDGTYTDMEDFLYNKADEMFGEESGYAKFSDVKKAFNITDVYGVQINAEYDTETSEDEIDSSISDLIEASATCFYVFNMDGQWKLDIPYSTYFVFSQLIEQYGDLDTAE